MEKINAAAAKQMILKAADSIIENKPLLTEVDSHIGDGDHGIGMATGMTKVREVLSNKSEFSSVYEPFALAGNAMISSMGGASGVIFGSLFLAGAGRMPAQQEMSTDDFSEMLGYSLEAIQKRGKANPGDKTMVDALYPAVQACRGHTFETFEELLSAAERAAQEGVEATKQMQAKFGRAKSLMGRAVGYQDAGATSVWLIFKAMKAYFAENREGMQTK